MKKLFPLVMAVVMVGSVVLMVMVIRGKTSAQNFRDQSKQLIEQANAVTSRAQTQFEKAQTQFEKAQAELVYVQAEYEKVQAKLATAQQAVQVMQEQFSTLEKQLDRIRSVIVEPEWAFPGEELSKVHAATAKAKAELKQTQLIVAELRKEIEGLRPPLRGVYTIQSHDIEHDFYVINAGSDNGIKKGDTFTVVRAGKEIGKIEIARTQPTVSIAVYQKGFPRPSAPFKSGERLMKVK